MSRDDSVVDWLKRAVDQPAHVGDVTNGASFLVLACHCFLVDEVSIVAKSADCLASRVKVSLMFRSSYRLFGEIIARLRHTNQRNSSLNKFFKRT